MKDGIMDDETIKRLNDINRAFYATTAAEFDATRQQQWPGWDSLLPHIGNPRSVLDVGCGNGRFGAFMAQHFEHDIRYHGVDNNAALLAFARQSLGAFEGLSVTLTQSDIVDEPLPVGEYDLVVLFGVIHHIPGLENRKRFMRELAKRVADGGHLAFAAWCFYDHARFRERITGWDDDLRDKVERHDYLLDWRRGDRALRYCHYVDEQEHRDLISASVLGTSAMEEVITYRADGASGDLNRYTILKTKD